MGASFAHTNIDTLVSFYKFNSPLDLFYHVAVKEVDLKELKDFNVLGDKLEPPKPPKPAEVTDVTPHFSKKDSELIIFGESSDRIMYALAQCCNPIPGDDVFGFVSTGKGLIIHRTNCPNAPSMLANYGHKIVKTKWAKNKQISFLTGLKIIGMDDVGVVNKITNVISGDLKSKYFSDVH